MNLAPIVLFVYNRPQHTLKTLNALKNNFLADKSVLYIYADGLKNNSSLVDKKNVDEVRKIIKKEKWCQKVYVIEQTENLGLAKSIVTGVTQVVNKHSKVIVLEDDIVTSRGFLTFMNKSLSFYENEDTVMHISGYMYPHNEKLPDTFFFNVTLCWGWATWKNSWKYFNNDPVNLWNEINTKNLISELDKFGGNHLSRQLAFNITGKLNTWFIKWHSTVFLKGGFSLFPKKSFVDNIGFDNSGIHNGFLKEFKNNNLITSVNVKKIDVIENVKARKIIQDFYTSLQLNSKKKSKKSLKKVFKNNARKLGFKLFPELKKIAGNQDEIFLKNSYSGKHVIIYPSSKIKNSIVGDYTYISQNAIVNSTIIGKFCSIGPNLISGWGIHPTDAISTNPMFYSDKKQNGVSLSNKNKLKETLPITIGNDVFIGMNVTILDGVKIGDGAVIGAGAVVSKDIPEYAIAAGNPIKILKYRFDDTIIKALLKRKWWDSNEEELHLIEKYFFNVEEYLKRIE